MADLVEVLIGTGMRKGEALGLHWADVHLPEGMLFIRCTLSAIDNNRLVLTAPKTRSSKDWIAISPRVAAALRRRRAAAPDPRQHSTRGTCDHNPRVHNQITVSKAPARTTSYATTPGTRAADATTLRPQPPKTRKRPSPHLCGNGLRPAKTLVGTTGFEPATP
ncbi:hypothetical protein SSPO_096110 [Streptomyces antimycoticus]|uniref:Tyr recombinase domain-containing protein n=1 Tax=Streptomyces antimycoticus TaxID=68175 RepID=A0A499UXU2_9ACTN|nr:hypothetical protein SSPO_096110 [Streptomyces antimycoticus]